MKLLHTADWHLGKKLEGKSQIPEQVAVLDEIYGIAKSEKVDVVMVTGDVFDVSVPPAEAEELFYEYAEKFSRDFTFIALAGNHDDAVRLCAAKALAKKHGMILCGEMDNSFYSSSKIEGGEGFIRMEIGNERVNFALLPYPLDSMLPMGEQGYSEKVKALIDKCALGFREGEINIFASHLFMSGAENEESTLGGARLLSVSVLPDCDYVALGHVHKPMTVSKDKNAYYSGSILPYHFDEVQDKSVNVVSFTNGKTEVKTVAITNYKKLVRIEVASIEEAEKALENCPYRAEIVYKSNQPVDSLRMMRLRKMPAFVKFTPTPDRKKESEVSRKTLSPEQLFKIYYKKKRLVEPDDNLTDLFLKALSDQPIIEEESL